MADIHSCSKINGKLLPVDDKTMLCAGGEGVSGGCQVSQVVIYLQAQPNVRGGGGDA